MSKEGYLYRRLLQALLIVLGVGTPVGESYLRYIIEYPRIVTEFELAISQLEYSPSLMGNIEAPLNGHTFNEQWVEVREKLNEPAPKPLARRIKNKSSITEDRVAKESSSTLKFFSPSYRQIYPKTDGTSELSVNGVEVVVVPIEVSVVGSNWVAYLEQFKVEGRTISSYLAGLANKFKNDPKSPTLDQQLANDFKNDEQMIAENVLTAKAIDNDEILLLEYGQQEQEKQIETPINQNLEQVKKGVSSQAQGLDEIISEMNNNFGSQLEKKEVPIVSSNVLGAIERELNKNKGKRTEKKAVMHKANDLTAMAQNPKPENQHLVEEKIKEIDRTFQSIAQKSSGRKRPAIENWISEVAITPLSVGLNKGTIRNMFDAEMTAEYDKTERWAPNEEGVINVEIETKSDGILNAVVAGQGVLRTNLEISVGKYSIVESLSLPLLEIHALEELLDTEKLRGQGAFLLIKTDSGVQGIEIDAAYEAQILLDQNFNVVREGPADYILFIGVQPGNVLVSYLLKNDYAEKILFLAPDEVTYDAPYISRPKELEVILVERNLLSSTTLELDVAGSHIKYFNRNLAATKEGINKYLIPRPSHIHGQRNYLEFHHLPSVIYAGAGLQERMELPHRDYISHIFDLYKINSLEGRCLVQVNLAGEIDRVRYEGISERGPFATEPLFLDHDGVVGDGANALTKKVFLLGHENGIFSIRIDYLDGKSDVIKSFCSRDTYLVEQL